MHTKVGIKQFKLWSFDQFWGVWLIEGHVSYHQITSTFVYAPGHRNMHTICGPLNKHRADSCNHDCDQIHWDLS